ncbi:uncharacterized protein LOC144567639 [Carex rostrata]
MEYTQKLAELESRMVNQMHQIRQPSEDQPPVSPGVRRSSQASGTEVLGGLDNLKEATACDLVMYFGTTPLTIARGIVYPPAAGDQLRPNYLRVAVDKITHDWAVRIPLPVPVVEMVVLDDARYAIVQWPKNQIILDNTRRGETINEDEALSPVRDMELALVSVAPEVPDAPVDAPLDRTGLTAKEVSCLPGQLQTLHAHLIKAPKDMTAVTFSVPPSMFLHDGREVVLPFTEFNDFLQASSSSDKWLDVGVITVFLMFLVQKCRETASKGKVNLCALLDPGRINGMMLE